MALNRAFPKECSKMNPIKQERQPRNKSIQSTDLCTVPRMHNGERYSLYSTNGTWKTGYPHAKE